MLIPICFRYWFLLWLRKLPRWMITFGLKIPTLNMKFWETERIRLRDSLRSRWTWRRKDGCQVRQWILHETYNIGCIGNILQFGVASHCPTFSWTIGDILLRHGDIEKTDSQLSTSGSTSFPEQERFIDPLSLPFVSVCMKCAVARLDNIGIQMAWRTSDAADTKFRQRNGQIYMVALPSREHSG